MTNLPPATLPTLHIEHPVTDLVTWAAAFARFADARHRAGVLREEVRHPAGDAGHVVVELAFATTAQAVAFQRFLEGEVWPRPDRSPALAGPPRARVLEPVDLGGPA